MHTNAGRSLLLAALLVLTGCSGVPMNNPPWAASDTTATTTSSPSLSIADAHQRVIEAERDRIRSELEATENVSGTSGTYGSINMTVVNQSETDAYVRVEMPYSYHCAGSNETIDDMRTTAVYHATMNETTLVTISEDVQINCT